MAFPKGEKHWKQYKPRSIEHRRNLSLALLGRFISKKTRNKISKSNTTHGEGTVGHQTLEYKTWISMKNRCNNPNYLWFKNYGGRGIKVCPEWNNSYEQFLKDMGRRPSGKYTIERIDNEDNYSKNNCRWITQKEQMRNTRRNILFNGEIATDASIRLGGCHKLVNQRLRLGWSKKRAFLTPLR